MERGTHYQSGPSDVYWMNLLRQTQTSAWPTALPEDARSQIPSAFATLHCVHDSTLKTAAWGRRQSMKTYAACKYAQLNISIQKLCSAESVCLSAGIQLCMAPLLPGQRGGIDEILQVFYHFLIKNVTWPLSFNEALLFVHPVGDMYDNYQMTWMCFFFY